MNFYDIFGGSERLQLRKETLQIPGSPIRRQISSHLHQLIMNY